MTQVTSPVVTEQPRTVVALHAAARGGTCGDCWTLESDPHGYATRGGKHSRARCGVGGCARLPTAGGQRSSDIAIRR